MIDRTSLNNSIPAILSYTTTTNCFGLNLLILFEGHPETISFATAGFVFGTTRSINSEKEEILEFEDVMLHIQKKYLSNGFAISASL
jgi:hypothetical protein